MLQNILILVLLGLLSTPVRAAGEAGVYDSRLQQAVAAGSITENQALVYGVWARFSPAKIPVAELRPVEAELAELANGTESVLREASANLESFTAAEQNALIPWLVTPTSPESAWVSMLKRPDGTSVRPLNFAFGLDDLPPMPDPIPNVPLAVVEDSRFRVWWQKDYPAHEADAQRALEALNFAAAKLLPAMGKTEFLDDSGRHEFTDLEGKKRIWGDGGNGKVDVYLFAVEGYVAVTLNYPPSCSEEASFIIARPSRLGNQKSARHVMAHELMHVIQNMFKRKAACKEYTPVDEGVAAWADDFVNPKSEFVHEESSFTHYGDESLLKAKDASWPFYYYLAKKGGTEVIRSIYQANASRGPYDSIDSVIDGGFSKQWPGYLVYEWNQLPNRESFKEWDEYAETPWESFLTPVKVRKVEAGASTGDFIETTDFELAPLTRRFFHYDVRDAQLRSISVEAPLKYWDPLLRLRVLVKRAGAPWVVEDWDGMGEDKEFCQDNAEKKLEELVLIFSHAGFKKGAAKARVRASMKATNLACAGWKGVVTATTIVRNPREEKKKVITSTVEFAAEANRDGRFLGRFPLASGSYSYVFDGKKFESRKTCVAHAEGSGTMSAGSAGGTLGLYPHHVKVPNARIYNAALLPPPAPYFQVVYACSDNTTITEAEMIDTWIINGFAKALPSGKLDGNKSLAETNYVWNLGPLN